MLVGLPIIKIIDHVLAATNSATKYGIGLIFEFLQKKQIKGVNVNITMSFDVKIVKAATKKYKIVNRINWLFLALFVARFARYLNRPTSSKKIDKVVIEKKRIIILILGYFYI